MKKFIAIVFSLLLAIGIVYWLPTVIEEKQEIKAEITNEVSLVKQEILSYSEKPKTYKKIYTNGNLIGVVHDEKYLNSLIDERYQIYEKDYPNTSLDYCDDIYFATEKSFCEFEDCDDEIMEFLVNHDLLGIKTTAIEFSTASGTYDIIYVKNIDDFYKARNDFLLNFVSKDTINKLENKIQIDSPTDLGTVEKNISVLETIEYEDAVVSPNKIFASSDQIYEYLCYGRNRDREYYTVKEGDTLQGICYYLNGMWPSQLVMINKDVLSSENQVITPGIQLNVTYFISPINVKVTKEVLSQQYITPENPQYIEDEEVEAGKIEVVVQEEVGIKNVLFEETWINGVLESGKQLSETVIKNPVQGIIKIGTNTNNFIGTGNYIWPVDNPYITTEYGGYLGHTGTDFINKYKTYCAVYAVDSGVVDEVGYKYDMGYYIMIDHQNGVRTFYMHLNGPGYVNEGDNVYRGQTIGQEGNSGESYGAHLHLTFEVNGTRVNACRYLPCNLIR